jgi:putative ABC transport system permease protein
MSLSQDIRYAFRTLRNAPGFSAIAIATLGLGIGANAAIFSVINGTLLRTLPYPEPERLVTVEHHYPSQDLHAPVSVQGFKSYQDLTNIFSSAAVMTGWGPSLTEHGDPERLNGSRVTGDYFATFRAPAALGRTLQLSDVTDQQQVVVLSNGLWQRLYGGDSSAIGKRMLLNGLSYEIVGVMPSTHRDFFNRFTDVWAPLVFTPQQLQNGWTNEWLNFAGRLAPGVTLEQAAAGMHAHANQLKTDRPGEFPANWDLAVTSLPERANANLRQALYVLLGAVGLVLLIACANVANLQLARAAARSREIAVRVALGASPTALVRQLLTESMILALAGGALGLLLASWGVPALLALDSNNLPPSSDIGLDSRVLLFSLGVSLLTGFVFGLTPAIRVARTSLQETLKEGGRGAAGDRGSLALRRGLVVATVALALTLLVGAGLMIRSFARLVGVDPGFRAEKLLTFNLSLPAAKYPNDTVRVATFQRFSEEVGALPGVQSVGSTSTLPFSGNWSTSSFSIEGVQVPANTPGPWGDIRQVTPGFLPAIDVRLKRGRQLDWSDNAGAPLVAVVDDEMVSRYWPKEDPIGKRLTFNNLTDSSITWITVVGVVEHTMHEGLDGDRRVQMYLPIAQNPVSFQTFAVRTTGDPLAMVTQIKDALKRLDPDLPISAIHTMEELIEGSTGSRRFSMVLLGIFSSLAALLAAIGLYGVMSFTVTQRSKELGVRLALGAHSGDVLRLVLRQGMVLVAIGVGLGLLAALSLTRVLRTMLFNVSTTDPLTFGLIALLLVAVTLIATWLPARRATRVDPVVVLRDE